MLFGCCTNFLTCDKKSDAVVDGNIYAASSASWYQLAIFESDFSKSKFKMLVGLCPNPICSASCRCRLRVCSKRFYNKTKRQTRVLLKGRTLVCRRLSGLCFLMLHFSSAQTYRIAGQGKRLFYHQSHKERCGKGDNFLQRRQYIEHNHFYSAYYKGIDYWVARIPTAM